jgi:hypothetical protein
MCLEHNNFWCILGCVVLTEKLLVLLESGSCALFSRCSQLYVQQVSMVRMMNTIVYYTVQDQQLLLQHNAI